MTAEDLTFIHISDIHFSKRSGDKVDLDSDLRSELENDVRRMKEDLERVNGILVTGDIGYSGQTQEYDNGRKWLTRLCSVAGCEMQEVWVVPGNHDVDRTTVDKSALLSQSHKSLRMTPKHDISTEMESVFRDGQFSQLLLKPVENYNHFSSRFECQISPDKLVWESDRLLNDGSTLRLIGLNSTLLSDRHDDDGVNRLIVGLSQTLLPNIPGVCYLTLCHHPPQWLLDGDEIDQTLSVRANVQLFGHKHMQHVEKKTVEKFDSVRMVAGAVHPERSGQQWIPRYNYVSLAVKRRGGRRSLMVTIYPRLWNSDSKRFDSSLGDEAAVEYELALPGWEPPIEARTEIVISVDDEVSCGSVTATQPPVRVISHGGNGMYSAKRLAYRFLTLPYSEILALVRDLYLLEDEDEGLRDFELFQRVFQRAKERQLCNRLFEEVEHRHTAYGEETLKNV